MGRASADVRSYRHDEAEVFGCCEGSSPKFLNAVIQQAIIEGYIERGIENYGILRLTPKGKKFLNKPTSFKIVEDNDFSEDAVDDEPVIKSGAVCAADPELFAILSALRRKIAQHHDLPPYVIFQDPSLEAMATTYPVTLEELANIPGVGNGKATRYGAEFVKVIKTYVDENEIERPEDLRIRTVANKSKLKISIIQAIDRKIDLNEIAEINNIDFDRLLDEIEGIVNAGTRLNLSYFIDEFIDREDQEEVFDYFRKSHSDSLNDAYKELCPEYNEDEIRLVRIKFLSDLGN